ncbi:MAG: ribonuclease III [Candidatus Eisenbacteria bacterium]|nr:ribonuclease III [Candidatus Eisenbacteria bacterium]
MGLFGILKRRFKRRPAASNDLDQAVSSFQQTTGVRFSDVALLRVALTHGSYVHEHPDSNLESMGRMELLGDSVLGLVVNDYLYASFPALEEGELTKMKSLLVSKAVLARTGRSMRLGDFLLLGEGEVDAGGRERTSIVADGFESVVGAIYLDQGLDGARRFISDSLLSEAKRILADSKHVNYKSLLQEHVQGELRVHPEYRVLSETGPEHEKLFTVEVAVRRKALGRGTGKSKKEAEQAAARQALAEMEVRGANRDYGRNEGRREGRAGDRDQGRGQSGGGDSRGGDSRGQDSRGRDSSKGRDRDYDRYRGRRREKAGDQDRSRDRRPDRGRDRGQNRRRDQNQDQNQSKARNQGWDQSQGGDQSQGPKQSQDRNQSRDRGRAPDQEKSLPQSGARRRKFRGRAPRRWTDKQSEPSPGTGPGPGERAGERPGERPQVGSSGESRGERAGEHAGGRPVERPQVGSPGESRGERPGNSTAAGAEDSTGKRPGVGPGEHPGERAAEHTGERPGETDSK